MIGNQTLLVRQNNLKPCSTHAILKSIKVSVFDYAKSIVWKQTLTNDIVSYTNEKSCWKNKSVV